VTRSQVGPSNSNLGAYFDWGCRSSTASGIYGNRGKVAGTATGPFYAF